jgi:hypothetical protein
MPNGDFESADRLLRSRGIPRSAVFCSQNSSDSVRVLREIIVVKVVQPMEVNWLWSKHLPAQVRCSNLLNSVLRMYSPPFPD